MRGRVTAERAVVGLIAATGLARLAAAWAGGLCSDEAYHFSCALRPSLSYFDHPPLSILLGSLSLALFGEPGSLALRSPFIALFAGTTWLVFVLGRRLFGPWPGFHAALLLNLTPLFSVGAGMLFRPDGPLVFFWLACVWCLVHVVLGPTATRPTVWWAAAGAALGLALLSKYTAVLLVVGACIWVLGRREQRRWLTHPGPYVAMAIALLLFSPVVVWNAQHGWISFAFQGTRGLDTFTGFHPGYLVANVVGQSLLLLPWVWVALVAELVRGLWPGPTEPARRFIVCLAATPIVLFTAVAGLSDLGTRLFHWAAPGYLLLLLPLGDTVHRALARGGRLAPWTLGGAAAATALAIGVVMSHAATGWLGRVVDPAAALLRERDPTRECIEFTPLERFFAERDLLGRRDLFVFSDRWDRAGKVEYGLKGKLPVLAFYAKDPRGFAFFDRSEHWLGKDGVLVTTKARMEEVREYFGAYFRQIAPLGTVEVGRGGRREIVLHLYYCQGLTAPYPRPYGRP